MIWWTVSCFIVDNKEEFSAHIDAPVETEAELQRDGIALTLHHGEHHHHDKSVQV